jgi:hypothetical protein
MLGFARFAEGATPLEELEAYLASRVQQMLAGTTSSPNNGKADLKSELVIVATETASAVTSRKISTGAELSITDLPSFEEKG